MTPPANALRTIEESPDVGIEMPDCCRLSARIWRPTDAADNPVPAILEFLPYRKRDGTTVRDALTHLWFAERGYAWIRVDMRGNGDSEGLMENEYTRQELDDAVATIHWLAQQPWCTGMIGMMGISWGGFNALQVATLATGGLGDAYKNTVPLLVEQLTAPVKGIVGPWVHKYPHFAVPEPRIGFLQEALRWWDHWLKGIDTGVDKDPAYRAYLMDGVRPQRRYNERSGRWIAEAEGATSHLPALTLGLSDEGLGLDGPLNVRVRSPQTCGMESGDYCAIWLGPDMPGDQRADDALSACFDGAPLAENMDIVGAPRIRLRLSADRRQAQIAVRLNHVHPDGASTRITYGVLNLTHRDSHAEPTPLTPGAVYDVSLDLDHIAYRVPKGHRLRVAISSAYSPLIWPSPEHTELHLTQGDITIPQRPSGGDEYTFPPPESAPALGQTSLRAPNNSRRVETDMNSGETHLIIKDDFGLVTNNDHGQIHGGMAHERWTIHPDDPFSARGHCKWTQEISRNGIDLRTETSCEMWADQNSFFLRARKDAFEGDKLVSTKRLEDAIPRDQM
ncbi:CocE/NonD family hydrolase [Ruegeria sp. MALMAid1280]|uniref:CocE/NonD family hydrolase n=1 Tax=Ruegeria sp. MALMAid1280 TaxID=3411634 RepID=UPI003BA322BA